MWHYLRLILETCITGLLAYALAYSVWRIALQVKDALRRSRKPHWMEQVLR